MYRAHPSHAFEGGASRDQDRMAMGKIHHTGSELPLRIRLRGRAFSLENGSSGAYRQRCMTTQLAFFLHIANALWPFLDVVPLQRPITCDVAALKAGNPAVHISRRPLSVDRFSSSLSNAPEGPLCSGLLFACICAYLPQLSHQDISWPISYL
jgi:hypothetical protein